MDDYIKLTFNILPRGISKSAHVLAEMTINQLCEEIERKVSIERFGGQRLYIWQAGQRRPLNKVKKLSEEQITDGMTLEVGFEPPKPPSVHVPPEFFDDMHSNLLSGIQSNFFDENIKKSYRIEYSPMVIGRSNPDTAYPFLQRINLSLQDYGEDARQISRDHAIITRQEERGQLSFFIISIAVERKNFTYLNGYQMEFFHAYRLQNRDQIRLGESEIDLTFQG